MNPVEQSAHVYHVLTDWLDITDPKRIQICAWCTLVCGESWALRTTLGRLAVAYHVWQFGTAEAATQFKLTWMDQLRMYESV
jgi:hypothetical protein